MGVLQSCYGGRVKRGTLYMICGQITDRNPALLVERFNLVSAERAPRRVCPDPCSSVAIG
jgi:hypothetical protein